MPQNATPFKKSPGSDDLQPDQLKAIAALASGASVIDAAAQAGVDRSTLYRWKEIPEFAAELNRTRAEQADAIRGELRALAGTAVKTIRTILDDPTTAPGVRLRASLAVLETLKALEPESIGPTDAATIRDHLLDQKLFKDTLAMFRDQPK